MKIKFKQWECNIIATHYAPKGESEKRKAILLVDIKDSYDVAVATINMPDHPCEENQVYIKDYSENEGMLQTLIDNNIVLPHPINILGGEFINVPLMQLTPEALKLWDK